MKWDLLWRGGIFIDCTDRCCTGICFAASGVMVWSFWLIVLIPIIHFAGILIERWLFFAEAKHVVTLFTRASLIKSMRYQMRWMLRFHQSKTFDDP